MKNLHLPPPPPASKQVNSGLVKFISILLNLILICGLGFTNTNPKKPNEAIFSIYGRTQVRETTPGHYHVKCPPANCLCVVVGQAFRYSGDQTTTIHVDVFAPCDESYIRYWVSSVSPPYLSVADDGTLVESLDFMVTD